MHLRSISALLLVYVVLFATSVRAEPASATAKPTAVVQLKALDDLMSDLRHLVKQMNREEEAKQIEAALKARTGPKGLEGIDTRKPIGLYGTVETKLDQSQVILLLPIADEKTFLDFLDAMGFKPEKDKTGLHTLQVERIPFPILFRFAHGYLHATLRFNDKATLATDLPRPESILTAKSMASIMLNVDQLPPQISKVAVSSAVLALANIKDQEMPGATAKQKELRDAVVDELGSQVKAMLEGATSVELALDLDRKKEELGLSFSVASKPNSTLAKNIGSLQATKSLASALTDRTSVMGGVLHVALPDALRKAFAPVADELVQKALDGADPNHKELITPLARALTPTARSGQYDLLADIRGPGKSGKYTFLASIQMEKGANIEKAFKELIANIPADAVGKLRLDVDKAGSVNIHRVNQELNAESIQLFGDSPVFFALREDALLVCIGDEALKTIKSAAVVTPAAAQPLRLELSMARLAPLLVKQKKEAPELAKKVFKVEGNDQLVLELKAGEKLEIRARMKTAVLTFAALMDKAK